MVLTGSARCLSLHDVCRLRQRSMDGPHELEPTLGQGLAFRLRELFVGHEYRATAGQPLGAPVEWIRGNPTPISRAG